MIAGAGSPKELFNVVGLREALEVDMASGGGDFATGV